MNIGQSQIVLILFIIEIFYINILKKSEKTLAMARNM